MSAISRSSTVSAAILLLTVSVVPTASAASVPITIKSSGSFTPTDDPSPCAGAPITDTLTGIGSHLGQLTGTYPHCVNFADGTFTGTATFEAANGDDLFVLLGGSADLACATAPPFICDVNFAGTIMGGTGRFEGASGALTGTGTVDLLASAVESVLTGTIN